MTSIKTDRIKCDYIKNDHIKSDHMKNDRSKNITDPYYSSYCKWKSALCFSDEPERVVVAMETLL